MIGSVMPKASEMQESQGLCRYYRSGLLWIVSYPALPSKQGVAGSNPAGIANILTRKLSTKRSAVHP
jgi:hypothetical protein